MHSYARTGPSEVGNKFKDSPSSRVQRLESSLKPCYRPCNICHSIKFFIEIYATPSTWNLTKCNSGPLKNIYRSREYKDRI